MIFINLAKLLTISYFNKIYSQNEYITNATDMIHSQKHDTQDTGVQND